jgi:uncharacterized membrane protein YfcA
MDFSLDALGYVAMLFVGGSLGLIGGGGAILTVPIMVYLFKIPAVVATSYSLFVVGLSSLFGVLRYHKERLVDYRTAVVFSLPSFLGTYLARRVFMPWIPDTILQFGDASLSKDRLVMVVFACVMVGASWSMIRGTKIGRVVDTRGHSWTLAGLGLVVGFVAGFVGAGGGFLIIPALVVTCGIPMQTAVGTSLLIIAANSLTGFSGDLIAGVNLDWLFLLKATGMALIGIFLGSSAARYVPSSKLKPAFGWFVLISGVYIMGRQILG